MHFIILCLLWYTSSSLTNNFNKQLMTVFPFPVSVVLVKFLTLLIIMQLINSKKKIIKSISWHIIICMLPISTLQVLGHITTNLALEYATVSFVHTIKATTPLFTVILCRMLGESFSKQLYLSLIPLMGGVMLVCATELDFKIFGLITALTSTVIFVLQNIFYKHLFDSKRHPRKILLTNYVSFKHNLITIFLELIHTVHDIIDHTAMKLDKLNVMYYSCFVSCIALIPYWLYTLEYVQAIKADIVLTKFIFLSFMVGTMHTLQSLVAFTIIDQVSPVSYSIASLFKRIVVIGGSFIWFNQKFQMIQGFGFLLTFLGLYVYQRSKAPKDRASPTTPSHPHVQ
eukprot:NODE_53_length_30760_cov_1.203712.p12 type:complete len:342 gc:universal NODE_53_length_30760_cov_1.203712:27225-26200(-)